MTCPVCNTELGFSIDDMEDFYYDCLSCQSALLITKGECKIVSQGKQPKESLSQKQDTPLDKPASQSPSLDSSDMPASALQSNLMKEESLSSKSETYIDPEIAQQLHQTQEEALLQGTEELDDKKLANASQGTEELDDKKLANASSPAPDLNESPSGFEEVTEVPEIPEEFPNEFKEEELEQKESSFVFNENDNVELQQPVKEDFSEELEFSKNKDNKQTGLYLYRLFLNEINSQALKDKVLSLIEDAQLELDESEYNSYKEEILHKGKVVFPKLSAIQMYVILHELMGLALKIHWEQNHVADS